MREFDVELRLPKVVVYLSGTKRCVFNGWYSKKKKCLDWNGPNNMSLTYSELGEIETVVKREMAKAESK